MQLVNRAQLLKVTFLFVLFALVSAATVFATVPLTIIYASLQSNNLI